MKLLNRQRLNTDLQEQRMLQAQEGLRLAQRIDLLRETLATLEKQHADFLVQSQVTYKEAISSLQMQKSLLEGEIARLEERKAILREPLDQEWEELERQKKEQEKVLVAISVRDTSVFQKESILLGKEKALSLREKAIEDMEKVAKEDTASAQKELERVNELSKHTKNEYQKLIQEQERVETVLAKKEKEHNRWVAALETKEKTLQKREKSLDEREKFVDHKFAVLQRNITKLNSKKHAICPIK